MLKMLTKKKEIKFKINGILKEPLYEKLKCSCDKTDITKMHPLKKCLSCYSKITLNSMPRKSFDIIEKDKNGKKYTRTINEITLDRQELDIVRGWSF